MKAALAPWAAAFVVDADLAADGDLGEGRPAISGVRVAIDRVDDASLARVRALRRTLADATMLVVTQEEAPRAALALLDAGATLVAYEYGYVFAGPLLAKRANDALAARLPLETDARPARARPWFWTLALGVALIVGGTLAWLVAATRVVLPYDEAFLGWSRATLVVREPRLLRFMTHDRITLAGSMLSLGTLYAGLALGDLRRGALWAKRTVVASGVRRTRDVLALARLRVLRSVARAPDADRAAVHRARERSAARTGTAADAGRRR